MVRAASQSLGGYMSWRRFRLWWLRNFLLLSVSRVLYDNYLLSFMGRMPELACIVAR
jgi:hypothetical protein